MVSWWGFEEELGMERGEGDIRMSLHEEGMMVGVLVRVF